MFSKKKILLNGIFFILIVSLTLFSVFTKENPAILLGLLNDANGWYWLAALILVFIFISCESLIIYLLLKNSGEAPKPDHCLLYSFIGFFFSSITPAAGGGQPAQVYFMNRDGIDPGVSTPILVVVTIGYKFVLIIYGILMLFIKPSVIFNSNNLTLYWCLIGFGLNVLAVVLFGLIVLRPDFIKQICIILLNIGAHFISKDKIDKWKDSLDKSIEKYYRVSKCIVDKKALFVLVIIISFIQRSILFSVTWLVMHSFGLSGYSLPFIITMQALVSLGTDLLPLPGGSGANEALFLLIFEAICGSTFALPVLVASRGISYYGQMLICVTMFLIMKSKLGKKEMI